MKTTKTIQSIDIYGNVLDWHNIASIELELSQAIINEIEIAQRQLEHKKEWSSIEIYYSGEIKQFDSTIDEPDRKELKDDDYFRTDCDYIKVYRHSVWLKAYGKYDASQYYEAEINL